MTYKFNIGDKVTFISNEKGKLNYIPNDYSYICDDEEDLHGNTIYKGDTIFEIINRFIENGKNCYRLKWKQTNGELMSLCFYENSLKLFEHNFKPKYYIKIEVKKSVSYK